MYSRIDPTRIGMPSMIGYSRWQARLEQTRIPSRMCSGVSRATLPMRRGNGSLWLLWQTGQMGRRVSKWRSRTDVHPPIMTVGQPGERIFPVGLGMGATHVA